MSSDFYLSIRENYFINIYQVLRTKARKIAVEIPLFRLAKGIKSETKGE